MAALQQRHSVKLRRNTAPDSRESGDFFLSGIEIYVFYVRTRQRARRSAWTRFTFRASRAPAARWAARVFVAQIPRVDRGKLRAGEPSRISLIRGHVAGLLLYSYRFPIPRACGALGRACFRGAAQSGRTVRPAACQQAGTYLATPHAHPVIAPLVCGRCFPAALRCCGPGLPRASSGLESRGVNRATIRRPPLALGKLRRRLLMLRFPALVHPAQPRRQQADNSAAFAGIHRAGKLRAQCGQETWPSLCCSLAFFLPCNSGSGEGRGPRAAHWLARGSDWKRARVARASLNLYLTNHQYIVCL